MKFQVKSAVMPIILINVAIFMLELILGASFTDSLILVSKDIFSRPWILVTSMFLHSPTNFWHILFNMATLFFLGTLLENTIGTKKFLFIYFLSGITAAFLASFFYDRALGASGAIMGVIGTLIILMPNLSIYIYAILPIPLWLAGILYALFDIFGVFFPSGVGNIAHLVGMGCGLLFGLYLRNQSKKFYKKFSSKKHLGSQDIEEYLKTGRI